MTDFAFTALDVFPAGTSVGAYPASAFSTSTPSGAPPVAASETQTMGATGATFTTLADGTYFFGASLSGTWHYVKGKVETGVASLADAAPKASPTLSGTTTVSGALKHTGTTAGFYSATPVAQPSAYTQTYSTAAKTVPAATAAAVATTAATNSSPYGYAQAQADAIPVAINANAADILALKKVVNAVIDDLQALGLAQ